MFRSRLLLICGLLMCAAKLLFPAEPDPQAGGAGPAQTDASSLAALKEQIQALREDYEKRIRQLEAQVEELQVKMLQTEPEPVGATAVQPAPQLPSFPGVLNPAIAAVGNFVGRVDDQKVYSEDETRLDNRFNFREAEIDFRVPVDPYADAVLIAAFGADVPGNFTAEIEEGYVNIKKLPFTDRTPLGLKLKVGRFRPSFGKTNLLHTHDLPQTFRPLPVQEFLGEEGFIQSGVSGNVFLPTPWDQHSSMDLTLQAVTGGGIAISPHPDSRTSYLGHLRWYRTFADAHDLELGWSAYGRPSSSAARGVNLQAIDFTYRWKPLRQGQWRSFLLGGELFFARRAYPEAEAGPDVEPDLPNYAFRDGKPLGLTVFGQWQLDRRKYAGMRYDRSDVVSNPGLLRQSLTPYFSYYFSEFLRFRLNYERRWSDLAAEDRRNSFFAELNFVFGSHPPEPFWVNK